MEHLSRWHLNEIHVQIALLAGEFEHFPFAAHFVIGQDAWTL